MTTSTVRFSRLSALLAVPAVALSAVVGVGALAAGPAHADQSCTGVVKDRVIRDDVRVPRGATCDMTTVRVDGNITLAPGATLRFRTGSVGGDVQGTSDPRVISLYRSTVDGNVQVKRAEEVRLNSQRVRGDVQVEGSTRGLDVRGSTVNGDVQVKYTSTFLQNSRVDGNVQHEEGRQLVMWRNSVGADTQAFKNRGWLDVVSNTIRGNLQCKENQAPSGWGNVVRGSKEDQCRRF